MQLTIGKKTWAGFGFALVLLIVLGTVAYATIARLVTTNHSVRAQHQVIGELSDLEVNVARAEGTAAAYVVSGAATTQPSSA